MASYLYATVVRLVRDAPGDGRLVAGDLMIVAGKHEEGYRYRVKSDEHRGFPSVECETVRIVGPAASKMGGDLIRVWAAQQPDALELLETWDGDREKTEVPA